MKLSPRAESLALFTFACFLSVMTSAAAVGVDPFSLSVPLNQTKAGLSNG